MAVEKDRIKARLKALFPKANLSKNRLDEIAARLSHKPADEADDAAIDEVLNNENSQSAMSFEEIARLDDKIRSFEAKAGSQGNNEGQNTGGTNSNGNQQQQQSTELSPEAKRLAELEARYDALEQKFQGQSLAQKQSSFLAMAKKEGIPENIAKYIQITEDTNTDEVLTSLKTDWKDVQQEQFNSAGTHIPYHPHGTAPKKDEPSPEMKQYLQSKQQTAQKAV